MLFESWLETRFGRVVKRNAPAVQAQLKPMMFGETQKLITSQEMFLYIPYRFITAGLAKLDDRTEIISQYALVCGDSYCVANVPAFVYIEPESRRRVTIGDTEYLEFYFDKNSVFIDNVLLFQSSSITYNIFNEEIAKGNFPLYLNENDALLFLDTAGEFANINLSKNNVAIEMIVASITRNATNPKQYYRHAIAGKNANVPFTFIALRNIQLGATNTVTKQMGSYYDMGLTSSLDEPSRKTEDIEALLRK